jgi:hypothetical protein
MVENMSKLDDLLAVRKAAKRETADVDISIGNGDESGLVTLRFTELDGLTWAGITDRHPPRLDVPIDIQYGYDVTGVVVDAASASGVLVEDDEELEVTEEQWRDLWEQISGNDAALIRDAIWGLNVYYPNIRVEALKKVRSESARS